MAYSKNRSRGGLSDAWFYIEGIRIHRMLGRAKPTSDLPANVIEELRKLVGKTLGELSGRREPCFLLSRPIDLTAFLRVYDLPAETPEGRQVFRYLKRLADRAEALDLPERERGRRC